MITNSHFKILSLELSHEKEHLGHLNINVAVEKNYLFQMSTSVTHTYYFLNPSVVGEVSAWTRQNCLH